MRLKQGDIIKLDFNPVKGHEQSGFRPAHVALDERTKITDFVMCDQVRTVSPRERQAVYIEDLPNDILCEVLDIIKGIIEI